MAPPEAQEGNSKETTQQWANWLKNRHDLSSDQTNEIQRIVDRYGDEWLLHVESALISLPAAEALALFAQDVDELERKIQVTAYLSSNYAPLYSLEDLKALIQSPTAFQIGIGEKAQRHVAVLGHDLGHRGDLGGQGPGLTDFPADAVGRRQQSRQQGAKGKL